MEIEKITLKNKHTIKYILLSVSGLVLAALLFIIFFVAAFLLRLDVSDPLPNSTFKWSYITYTSSAAEKKFQRGIPRTILLLPNNTRTSTDDYNKHLRMAKLNLLLGKIIFGKYPVTIVSPVFPRLDSNWQLYKHALDRDTLLTNDIELKRLDLQALSKVDTVISEYDSPSTPVNSKVVLFGFSASGMFVNRFAILHPERIKAAIIGAQATFIVKEGVGHNPLPFIKEIRLFISSYL